MSAREQKDKSKEFIYLLQDIDELLGESIFVADLVAVETQLIHKFVGKTTMVKLICRKIRVFYFLYF